MLQQYILIKLFDHFTVQTLIYSFNGSPSVFFFILPPALQFVPFHANKHQMIQNFRCTVQLY